MKVSEEDIRAIAELAHLGFESDELTQFAEKFNTVLSYVDQLRSVATEGITPMSHAVILSCMTRPDDPDGAADDTTDSKRQETILENAPDREARFFKVPQVITK